MRQGVVSRHRAMTRPCKARGKATIRPHGPATWPGQAVTRLAAGLRYGHDTAQRAHRARAA